MFLLSIWDGFATLALFITHDVDEAVYLSDRVVAAWRAHRAGWSQAWTFRSLGRGTTRRSSRAPKSAAAKHRALDLIEGGRGD